MALVRDLFSPLPPSVSSHLLLLLPPPVSPSLSAAAVDGDDVRTAVSTVVEANLTLTHFKRESPRVRTRTHTHTLTHGAHMPEYILVLALFQLRLCSHRATRECELAARARAQP